MLSERRPSEDPETVGNFHILGRLGAGGFGTVFAAHDHDRPDELVAVKVLKPPEDARNFAGRFTREIEAIMRVESRYVPAFIGAGTGARLGDRKGLPWLAIELVPGLSLQEVVKTSGPLAEPAVWEVGSGIRAGLAAIDHASLVHRDLKPGNVLITSDVPKIIDFGLVHLTDLPHSQWSREWRVGTWQYTPPEMLLGAVQDGKTAGDIFMLGGTLLYAATGHPPFYATSARSGREQPDLSGLPDGLISVVGRCLQDDQENRPTLDWLALQFGRRARGDQALAGVLPSHVLRLLDIFRRELDDALKSCASPAAWSDPVKPFRDRTDQQTLPADPPTRKDLGQNPPTRPYTRAEALNPDEEVSTVTEEALRPRSRVIRPVLLDNEDPRDARDESWQSVRWACQFGTWVRAPVTVVGRVAVAVDLNGTIGALDALEGSQLWAFSLGAAAHAAVVPLPGPGLEVGLGDAEGVVHAVGLQTSQRRTLLRADGPIHGPVVVEGDRVYAVSADGRLYTIDAETTAHTVLFSSRDLAPCAPAALAGTIFAVTTQGEVLAIDSVSGEVRWSVTTGGRICASPLPVRDRLYIAGTDGLLLEVDSVGRKRGRADLKAAVHVRLAHDGDRLFAGTSDGTVRAFGVGRQHGHALDQIWESPLGGEVAGLAVAGGQVYAAAGDSVLRLDPARGARTRAFRMECPIAAAPTAAGGLLYVAGLGGTVCCLSPT
jgi:serine/threonine protein kinase/outer membrane protein assembly factor BamB